MAGAEISDKIGKISRKEYESLKQRALSFEEKNNQTILVIPCDGDKDWCEMGDNSALIYKYQVCQKIGAPTNFSDDKDSFYTQFKMGKIMTRGFETVRNRIKKAELYQKETKKDKYIIFWLNKPLDDDEMKHITKLETERQERIKNIVKTGAIYPELYRLISETSKRYKKSILQKLDRESRATIGTDVLRNFINIFRLYYEISANKSNQEDNKTRWREIESIADTSIVGLQIISEQETNLRDVCSEVGMKMQDIVVCCIKCRRGGGMKILLIILMLAEMEKVRITECAKHKK